MPLIGRNFQLSVSCKIPKRLTVADPGFDLGGVDFVKGGGVKNVLKVEVKVIFSVF